MTYPLPMASTRVTVTGPSQPFKENSSVELNAAIAPSTAPVSAWKWEWSASDEGQWADIPGQTSSTYAFKATADHMAWVRAVALVGGIPARSDPFEIKVTAAQSSTGGEAPATPSEQPATVESSTGGATPATPSEQPATWYQGFAIVAFLVAATVFVFFLIISRFFSRDLGLSQTAYDKLDGGGVLGARLIGPIAIIGVLTLLIGIWMTATEWRGRFVAERADENRVAAKEGAVEDASKLRDALGKLKGATLVLVCGVLILLGVAWMTSSAAG